MRIRIIGLPLLLCSSLSQAQSATGTANITQQPALNFSRCFSHVPLKVTSDSGDTESPITVTAQTLEATQDGKIIYQGDVHIDQGARTFSADYMELEQLSKDVLARGNIHFSDGTISVDSEQQLTGNLTTKDSKLEEANYQFHGEPGRGKAKRVTLSDNTQRIDLSSASYTTCGPQDEAWQLKASSVKVEQDEVFGEAWNAVLWVGKVPVFYFPYIRFPIKDERQSGLLYPDIKFGGKNGTDITQPYYWNIAPNYDATVGARYMERRGTMAQLEFRYLPIEGQSGTLYGEYLSSDSKLDDTEWEDNARWLFNWRHHARFDDAGHWRADVDYTKVAGWDYKYFDDFSPPVGQLVDDQLMQSFKGGYYDKNWQLTTEVRDYQILRRDLPNKPFQLAPSLVFNSYQGFDALTVSMDSELTQFKNDGKDVYEATRFHAEPKLTYAVIDNPGTQVTADVGAYYTHYKQDVPATLSPYYGAAQGFTPDNLDSSVNRLLPHLGLSGSLVFDRETQWFEQDFTQTIEPQLKYLYVPYKDQDNIGLYDTTNMRQDYYSLFSDRRYAGLDRISDANHITAGFTSRIYDADNVERLRLALAQTYNFTSPRVRLFPNDTLDDNENKRSFLTFEGDLNIDGHWFIHSEAQQDTRQQELAAGNITLEYDNHDKLAQIGFRHLNKKYFKDAGLRNDLNQLGGTFAWPLARDWQLIGGYYRDIELNRNIDSLIGLRYDSCCWAVSLVWEQYEEDNFSNTAQAEKETMIGLQFELKGLSSFGAGSSSFKPGTHLLPYYRPFNLNN